MSLQQHQSSSDKNGNPKPGSARRSPLALLFLGIVRLYQLVISPLLGPRCRFQPTCSSYAVEAISLHGGLKGGWLTLKRISKCHPWGGFGYDPVPQGSNKAATPERDGGPLT